MKKIFIVFLMFLAVTVLTSSLSPKQTKAATMPGILWSDGGFQQLFISVADLGLFINNEWEIIGTTNFSVSSPIGIGLRFYNPSGTTAGHYGMHINADDNWLAHSQLGVWSGSGSAFYHANSGGWQTTGTLLTAPPARVSESSSPNQR